MFNRVVSNVGFLLAGVYALSRIKDISWLFRDRWMWTFGAMAFLPLIYDIVQQGIGFYEERGIMKMVLILFPSFVFAFSPDKKQISIVHKMVILMMCLSSFYTLSQYFINAESILLSYKVSKVMPVLSYGDHIRISWLTVISMVMALFEWRHTTSRNYKILLVVYFIFQYIFIHLLSAKTGLITLYATVAIVSFYLIPKNKMWWLIFIYTLVVACGIVAIQKIPSLKERVNFMSYDFEHYSKGEYREGLSDAIRFFSLKAGKDIIVSHPILGVGFSKLQHETSLWYDANMPQVAHKERFIPSSQLVIYWASSGILGLIIFLLHVLYPLFRPFMRLSVWFMAFFIPAVLSFSYETHLEGQLPLFVYSFFTAWFWYLATRKVID
jgi:O-antigen ligase